MIKTINFNQHEIIRNILELHNGGNPIDADITYSKGKFYGSFVDSKGKEFEVQQPKYKYDVCPLYDDVAKIEKDGNIPLEDASIDCIMIDLPFVITSPSSPSLASTDRNSSVIIKRFSFYSSKKELLESYRHWIGEAYRVLKKDGILIFKCQPTISSSKQIMTNIHSCNMAEEVGFYIKDEFVLLARNRLIGKVKKQQHARKYHSYFYVFKKVA